MKYKNKTPKWELFNLVSESKSDNVIKFTETNNIGPHWAYFNVQIPTTNDFQSVSLNGRIQIKNINAYGLRLRFVGGSLNSNAWVIFNDSNEEMDADLSNLQICDDGLSVWFIDKNTVIVDFSLVKLKMDHLSIGIMAFEKNNVVHYESLGHEFLVEKVSYECTINTQSSKVNHEQHSKSFAGMAIELCKGTGVEIGALHRSMPLDAQVIYLDHYKTEELRQAYAGDPRVSSIRQVQIAWKNGTYPFFDDNAFDFVINSHVLEHVANPGKQIEEWLRIVRPDGILYMIVPDKNYCFDRRRKTTPVEHLLTEYADNITEVSIDHYEDYIVNTNGEDSIKRDTSETAIRRAWEDQDSIHVHTFEPNSLKMLFDELAPKLHFELIYFEAKGLHIHCALKKM